VHVVRASRCFSSSQGESHRTPSLQGARSRAYGEDWGKLKEHRVMWSYVQMSYPLLTVALAAAMCLGVVSFIVGQAKPHR
jgi:hypothetical protein